MSILSLQHLSTRSSELLLDQDPLVRVSAIHHAGISYRETRDEQILARLSDLMQDPDPFVCRYSAVTLAQNDDVRGVDWMLKAMMSSQDEDPELWNCLRASTRFPFLGLLAEHMDLQSIGNLDDANRDFLSRLVRMNEDDFLDFAEQDPKWRSDVLAMLTSLDRIAGLRIRPGKMLMHGYVLSQSVEHQPGFVSNAETGGFFQYFMESCVNPNLLASGKEALFIANPHDPNDEISTLYVLRDPEELSKDELSQLVMATNFVTNAVSAGPLLPLLAVQRINAKLGIQVLGIDGHSRRESRYIKNVKPGQLALLPQPTNNEESNQRVFFVPGIMASPAMAKQWLKRHAEQRGLRMGTIVHLFSKQPQHQFHKVKIQIHSRDNPIKNFLTPKARQGDRVLLAECDECQTKGVIECPDCRGVGHTECVGLHKCGVCKGTGKTKQNHPCTLCPPSHKVQGCNGTGKKPMPAMLGQERGQVQTLRWHWRER